VNQIPESARRRMQAQAAGDHPDADLLAAFAEHTLAGNERERVLSHRLTTDDLMGGTFTIMGPASEHTLWSQPIIIQPEVAVLSIGAVRQVPVVVNVNGTTSIAVGRRLVLALTFDHRVCEPFAATGYLERVGELLAGLDLESEH